MYIYIIHNIHNIINQYIYIYSRQIDSIIQQKSATQQRPCPSPWPIPAPLLPGCQGARQGPVSGRETSDRLPLPQRLREIAKGKIWNI